MISTLILVLALFLREHLQKSHPLDIQQNCHIQDAIFHPTFPPFILDLLSYIQMFRISTFFHRLINHSTYRFMPKIPSLRYIMMCFLSLNINNKIHKENLGDVHPPKKLIHDFQALSDRYFLLNSSNFSTNTQV